MKKIKPCKKCGSKNITFYDCNYSSFNPGGGICGKCKFEVTGESGCSPSQDVLISIWNNGQKLNDSEKLKLQKKINKELIKLIKNALVLFDNHTGTEIINWSTNAREIINKAHKIK